MPDNPTIAIDQDCPICNFPEMYAVLSESDHKLILRGCRRCGYRTAGNIEHPTASEVVESLHSVIASSTGTLDRLLNQKIDWTTLPTEDLHQIQWDLTMLSGVVTSMLVERAGHQDLG